ncbi:hypothetical protein BJ742DRAFT_781397 [Cladochytrium replicatum]|nr:hypothetical protein BJ742DRAFT_781397 [Cladochytrium replicatum]
MVVPPFSFPLSTVSILHSNCIGASAGLLGSFSNIAALNVQSQNCENIQRNVQSVKGKDGDEEKWVLLSGRNVLDNHQINFVSSLITAMIGGAVSWVYSSHCNDALEDGSWHPRSRHNTCTPPKQYSPPCFHDSRVNFFGDSSVRALFNALLTRMEANQTVRENRMTWRKHYDHVAYAPVSVTIAFPLRALIQPPLARATGLGYSAIAIIC